VILGDVDVGAVRALPWWRYRRPGNKGSLWNSFVVTCSDVDKILVVWRSYIWVGVDPLAGA
jgi:hypothetical protein